MILVWEITKYFLWVLARGLFVAFQTCVWYFTGISRQAERNSDQDAYRGTAHVLTVLARHKLDLLAQASGADNFMLTHNSFQDPEYVLKDYVTLYSINSKEAIFVESHPDLDVTKSECNPFLRVAQFQNARRIIKLPIATLHKLSKKIGKPKAKMIFVSMTARCGSTLLTQIFEGSGMCVTFSEPDALYTLLACMAKGSIQQTDIEERLEDAVNLLCKSRDYDIASYVVKLAQPSAPLVPYLAKLYPEARHIFMYRNGLDMCLSMVKSVQQMPLTVLLFKLAHMFPRLVKALAVKMKVPTYNEYYDIMIPSYMHMSCAMWALGVKQYTDFRKMGIELAGVRYEDMLADNFASTKAIVAFCGVNYDEHAVTKAYGRDAQRGSPLSREKLSRQRTVQYTQNLAIQMDLICNLFGAPKLTADCFLPGTITANELNTTTLENNHDGAGDFHIDMLTALI